MLGTHAGPWHTVLKMTHILSWVHKLNLTLFSSFVGHRPCSPANLKMLLVSILNFVPLLSFKTFLFYTLPPRSLATSIH